MSQDRYLPWFNWAVTTLFVLFQFFLQAAAGLMAHFWQIEFKLMPSEVGYLTAAFYFSYVIMQIPVGLAYDNFGPKRILSFASLTLCFGIVCLALSQNYWQAMLGRLLMGVGSSFGFIGMLYVTASWFSPKRFGILIGLSETLAMLGVSIAEIGMAWIVSHYGWRIMMAVGAAVMFLISLFIIGFIKDRLPVIPIKRAKIPVFNTVKQLISLPIIWVAGLYGFAMFSIINVFVALWGIPFFRNQYVGLSLHDVSLLMSMVFLGTAIGAPFNGWLINYMQKRQLIMKLFSVLTALLLALILYVPKLTFLYLIVLLFLIGFCSSSYIQVFAIVKENVDAGLQATALATTNMILMASAPLLQPLIGLLLELHYSYAVSLSLLEINIAVAILLSFYLPESQNPDVNKI